MKPYLKKCARLFVGGLFFYTFGYAVTVRRGRPGSDAAGPDDRISCPAVYFDDCDWMVWLFRPANTIDRLLRPNYWNPIVRDLVEEIKRSGEYRIEPEATSQAGPDETRQANGVAPVKVDSAAETPAPR